MVHTYQNSFKIEYSANGEEIETYSSCVLSDVVNKSKNTFQLNKLLSISQLLRIFKQ